MGGAGVDVGLFATFDNAGDIGDDFVPIEGAYRFDDPSPFMVLWVEIGTIAGNPVGYAILGFGELADNGRSTSFALFSLAIAALPVAAAAAIIIIIFVIDERIIIF